MLRRLFSFLALAFIAASCGGGRQAASGTPVTVVYNDYSIGKNAVQDSSLVKMLQPYSASLVAEMSKVIGRTANELKFQRPEGNLGNLMADCMRMFGEKTFNRKVDLGFMNPGGIRSWIARGDITVGKVFELMPFDNVIVLQEVKGTILREFLDKTAADGGWAVSGMTMQIRNGKAVNVLIDHKPLDENATYVIANSDYVANGGDNCEMLKKLPRINKGYLFRNALMDFITLYTQQGKAVEYNIEKRVSHAG